MRSTLATLRAFGPHGTRSFVRPCHFSSGVGTTLPGTPDAAAVGVTALHLSGGLLKGPPPSDLRPGMDLCEEAAEEALHRRSVIPLAGGTVGVTRIMSTKPNTSTKGARPSTDRVTTSDAPKRPTGPFDCTAIVPILTLHGCRIETGARTAMLRAGVRDGSVRLQRRSPVLRARRCRVACALRAQSARDDRPGSVSSEDRPLRPRTRDLLMWPVSR
jgi:hypothetical protein